MLFLARIHSWEVRRKLNEALLRLPDRARAFLKRRAPFRLFTSCTRVLLALGFLPSGLTKVLGHRFTLLSPDVPIGYFLEALYQAGFYWRFIGLCQFTAAILLLIPISCAGITTG